MLLSVGIAIYGLILFLYNFHSDIKHHDPVWKFASVKIALFLSIWQRIVLKFLHFRKIVKLHQSVKGVGRSIDSEDYTDDLLVSLEMFVLALIVQKCYTYIPYASKRNKVMSVPPLITFPKIL